MRYASEIGSAKVLVGNGPTHAGMGVVTDSWHVMTCAHVINRAVERPEEDSTFPADLVTVQFPLSSGPNATKGNVIVWHPIGDEPVADVAVLKLASYVPQEVGIANFARVHGPMNADLLQVFGVAAGHQFGGHVETKFMGYTDAAQVQIDAVNSHGLFIEGGYSGAAVWNTVQKAFVGMVRAKHIGPGVRVAYMISTDALSTVWRGLSVREHRQQFVFLWSAIIGSFLILLLLLAYAFIVSSSS
jgi:hypothetical protein